MEYNAVALESYCSMIYETNGQKPIFIIARKYHDLLLLAFDLPSLDSMGSLLTLSLINKRRKELFRGCIFLGPPFKSVPVMLWLLRRGAPMMINKRLLSAETHFGFRSSYSFLPTDGKALVDDKGQDILIDYFNAEE